MRRSIAVGLLTLGMLGLTAWIVAFLASWAILRVLALVPIVGGLVGFAAMVLGLGALIVAIWRAQTTSQAAPATA